MDPSIIDQRFHLESPAIKDKHLQPGHVVYAPYPGIQPQIESYYWGRITKKFRLVGVRAYRYSIEFVDGDELTCIGSDPMHRLREALRLMERGQIHENWPPRAYEEIQQDLEDEGSSSSYSGADCVDEEDDDFLPNETLLQQHLDSDDLMDEEEEEEGGCLSREASLQERTPIQSETDDLIGDEDDVEEKDSLTREAKKHQPTPNLLGLEDPELDKCMSAEIDEYMKANMSEEEDRNADILDEESEMNNFIPIIDLTISDSEEEHVPKPTLQRKFSVGKVIHSDRSSSSSSCSSSDEDEKKFNDRVNENVSPRSVTISATSMQPQNASQAPGIATATTRTTQPSSLPRQDESSDEIDSSDDDIATTPKKRKTVVNNQSEIVEQVEMPSMNRRIHLEQAAEPKSSKDKMNQCRGKRVALKTMMGISPSHLPISRRQTVTEMPTISPNPNTHIVSPSCGVLEKEIEDTGAIKGFWKWV